MRMFIPLACLFLIPACGGDGGSSQATTTAVTSAPSGATRIGDIQDAGNISPLEGQVVTVSGTVTGDFQENDADERRNLGGFFIQDDPPDANPQTSDGIFVFDGNDPAADIDVGDVVEVEGTVVEYFGETQINAISVRVTGTGALVPFPIDLPINDATTNSDGDLIVDLEHLEGMLVTFTDTLTVTNLRNLERFGTVTLSEGGRLYQYTNYNSPDVDGYNAHKNLIARRSIVLDDGLRAENPSHIHYLKAGNTAGYSLRAGDNLTNLTGTLRYSRGAGGRGDETWRLMPTEDPTFESANPRPGAPSVGGSIRVASFNVLNYFSTVDSGQDNCGPEGESACRGADSDTEFARQLEKTVTALKMLDADIVGLMELENNANESISTIVDALNARIGSGDYSYIDTGTIHDDAIKTGFIYRETVVSPSGDFALLDRSVDSRFNDARNRPALAQTFSVNATAAELTVVVNHLKSKGSSCESDGDPNLGDGQGNCNLIRANAAAALADWIEGDPTGSGDADFLIIGDLNAYASEDPLAAFENAGLTSLLGEQTNPYSFLFDAQSGALDHAVVSASLLPQVVGTIEWHINADEPPLLDYNLEYGRDPALFDGSTPYRASDHDPVVIGLDLTN
ncbi:MAG: ExeM/NucH family extracellular endonuclease [Gammaproteobacteria bacterium]|nr:ExeM/NucH family extracellular endonuclease [Gammaproteobacteria bacterium]